MDRRALGLFATALVFAVACAGPTSSGPAGRQPSASAPAGADPAARGGTASTVAADPTPWPASAPRTSMKIGLNAFSASLVPLWVAKDAGIFDKYGFNGVATTRSYLQQHPDLVRRFMMAHVEGIARVYQDKPGAEEALLKYLRSDDRELMDRTYDLITPFFEKVPYPAAASIQTVIDQRAVENPDASKLTPAAVSDDSMLKELEDAGFITRLYGTSSPSAGR
jgi:hypothetical protein